MTEAGGTFTFTSSGGSAGTATVTGPVSGIVVPTSTTLSISSALAAGKAFSGAGTALVVASAAGEDLTAFTGTGVTGFQLATGQNYTLTAAQSAIGRIGAGGAAGVLTDAGTITVSDTLAALGGGVANTLKTNGADSVVATAATGADISAITVAGIDSIVLGAGQNYTMTAAQAALVDGTAGAQTVTLTTLATGVLATTIESFVLGDFTNAVTLGTAAQNVTGPAGNVTTLTIGGNTVSGTWAFANGADVLVATTGANIAAVNSGTATTSESLDLTGAITMTQAQHEALAITAGGGADAVTITTGGAVTGQSGVESYTVSAGGSNTLAVLAGATAINGSASNATTVTVGGNTVTGTWALAHTGDGIVATDGADISGVNLGGATTAEDLTLTGAITMTQAQHAGLTVTASGGADHITITNGGAVAAQAGVETYTVAGAASNVTVNASTTGLAVNGAAGFATTVTVGGNTATGTYNLANGADRIVATTGANITGATTASVETLTMTGNVTMTAAQYDVFNAGGVTAAGGSDRIILSAALNGGQTLNAEVENFTLAAGANSVALGANGQSIDATALAAGINLTLSGSFAATVSLAAGNLLAGTATGDVTVTGGTGANTITTGTGADTVNAGDGGDFITGGAGIDILNGENGNDTFVYGSMADFYTGQVVDQIDGGANTDAVVINGDAIVLTVLSDLTRMTNVEQIKAQTQSATLHAHSIVISSNALLGGVNTIDLSGDTKSTSTATIDFTGVTAAMTLKGVGAGANTIAGGSGADILVGGTGSDLFLFGSAAAAAADTVIGGGGTDTVLFRSTAGETLVVGDNFSAGLSYLITTNSTAGAAAGTTSENINASTHTLGGVKLTGNGGNNLLTGSDGADTLVGGGGTDTVRGGGGSDTITTFAGGTTTYVFEATASANGVDTLTGVRSGGTFKFSDFLVTGVSMKNAAVDSTNAGVTLDLTGADHIGVRYASSTLTSTNIVTAVTGAAGEVLVADNGKAVVFSFSGASTGNSANGAVYYVEDVDAGAGQTFIVTLVGTMGSSTASVGQIVSAGGFL